MVETTEDWWYLPDGRTVHVTAAPNPQGGVIQIFDDATERFSLESRVNALSRTQRETIDSLREGVAVFGSDGRLKLSNPAFAAMWKLSPEMLAREPHADEVLKLCRHLAPAEDAWAAARAALVGVREGGAADLTARLTRLDGSVLDTALVALPDGGSLMSFADVTDNVNVEKALTERNEALERAAKLRDDFVHHVSYALRSPLTAIIGFAQLIGEEIAGPLNPRQREYAQLILRSSGTLLAIINDILDLASIDNDALTLDLETTDTAELVDSAARGLEDQLAENAITLERMIAPGAETLTCDARRLRQALYNLLSNAVGFSQKGQRVEISVTREGAETVFTVTDHGRGIPDAVRDKVFARFESHTGGTRHRGVGLGLAIVRSFVELHGGTVSIRSEAGQGTAVTCRIPDPPPAALPGKAA
jgi:signal transduction histidine kinase